MSGSGTLGFLKYCTTTVFLWQLNLNPGPSNPKLSFNPNPTKPHTGRREQPYAAGFKSLALLRDA